MSDDTCLFCSIVSGSTAAAIVNEDEHTLTFLDHRPLFPGHCLLIPKEHFETLTDLPSASVAPLFQKAQQLSRAVEAAMGAEGTFVAMNNRVSQSVPHLHIHIVPRKRKDGLKGFFWPRTRYKEQAEMVEVAKLIANSIEQQINSSS